MQTSRNICRVLFQGWLWTLCWGGRAVWRRWRTTGMSASTSEQTSSLTNTGKSSTPVKNFTGWRLLCGEYRGLMAQVRLFWASWVPPQSFTELIMSLFLKWIVDFSACPLGTSLQSWRPSSCFDSLPNYLRWNHPNRRLWTSGWSCFCRRTNPQFPPAVAQ